MSGPLTDRICGVNSDKIRKFRCPTSLTPRQEKIYACIPDDPKQAINSVEIQAILKWEIAQPVACITELCKEMEELGLISGFTKVAGGTRRLHFFRIEQPAD